MASSLLNISAGTDPGFTDSFEHYANSALVTVDFHKTITALEASARATAEAVARIERRIDDVAATAATAAADPSWLGMGLAVTAPLAAYLLFDKLFLRR